MKNFQLSPAELAMHYRDVDDALEDTAQLSEYFELHTVVFMHNEKQRIARIEAQRVELNRQRLIAANLKVKAEADAKRIP